MSESPVLLHQDTMSNLAKIVEVIFAVDPAMWWSLVDTIGFVCHATHVRTFAVEKHSLEQLQNMTHTVIYQLIINA